MAVKLFNKKCHKKTWMPVDDDSIVLIRIKSGGKFVIVQFIRKLIRIFDENHPSNCHTDYALYSSPVPVVVTDQPRVIKG